MQCLEMIRSSADLTVGDELCKVGTPSNPYFEDDGPYTYTNGLAFEHGVLTLDAPRGTRWFWDQPGRNALYQVKRKRWLSLMDFGIHTVHGNNTLNPASARLDRLRRIREVSGSFFNPIFNDALDDAEMRPVSPPTVHRVQETPDEEYSESGGDFMARVLRGGEDST